MITLATNENLGAALIAMLFTVTLALGLLLGYFLPALVANARKHKNTTPIFLVNLFFGWTFIGWAAALIWSFTDNTRQ